MLYEYDGGFAAFLRWGSQNLTYAACITFSPGFLRKSSSFHWG